MTENSNTAYLTALKSLNSEQKQAVEHTDGPLMIIAGPGTGKTQTIALRIAHILQTTHMRPSNILCLTFSVSGAKAMRERLQRFIGADAYAVTIQTVHGFCNDIIQNNGELFEDFNTLEQADKLEQLQIVRAGIQSLPIGSHLRKIRLENDRASDVLSRITELKRENKRPSDLTKIIPLYSEQILYTKNGKLRGESAALEQDKKRVEQFTEFIAVYKFYEAELQRRQKYDFNDMILTCLDVLKKHEWILAPLQERYQYILVDEFQDLNAAQFAVLETLTTYVHTDQAPNIACIGDDDQAIYRFQGASVSNMHNFVTRYPAAKIITLTENYRSTHQILAVAESIIVHNTERLSNRIPTISKILNAQSSGTIPECIHVPNEETQAAYIAKMLLVEHDSGTPWSDMAVICRTNDEVLSLYELLSTASVPCDVQAKRDLLSEQPVQEILSVCKAILSPHDASTLSTALLTSIFNIPALEHAEFWYNWRKYSYEQSSNEPTSLLQFGLQHLNDTCIHVALQKIWHWHTVYTTMTLPALIEEILSVGNKIPNTTSTSCNTNEFILMNAFFDVVRTMAYANSQLRLPQLLQVFDEYLAEPTLHLSYDLPHIVHDGVQLLTAHAAKGLEYTLVFVPNVYSTQWEQRRPKVNLHLPVEHIYGIDGDESLLRKEDERRLFFVACTRAKRKLYMCIPEAKRSNLELKVVEPSVFIAEAQSSVVEITPKPADLPSPLSALIKPPVHIDSEFQSYLEKRVSEFELSVTALNAFLDDPQKFLWEQLLKRPQAKKPNLSFGTAVHAALESFAQHSLRKETIDYTLFQNVFERQLKERELLTLSEQEEYLHLGTIVLPKFFAYMQQESPLVVYAEKSFSTIIDAVPIKGKVDRIDLLTPHTSDVRIVDYKTGTVHGTEASVRKKPDLFRQLVFYKLLADNTVGFAYKAVDFRLDFIGNASEPSRSVTIQVSNEEAKDLTAVIQRVWQKIQALDFTPLTDSL
jgi:DNA helicase II / ATP-dependent DNA helicase PcrA